jgi:hypothetical protein
VVGSLPRTVARQDSLLYIAGTDEARVNGYFLSSALRRATWRSGYATVCKTVYPGSIPGVASTVFSMGWVGISVPSAKW